MALICRFLILINLAIKDVIYNFCSYFNYPQKEKKRKKEKRKEKSFLVPRRRK
jgi:hypothetical protein